MGNFFQDKINYALTRLNESTFISRLTVTKKVVMAYALVAGFSLIAIIFALNSLHSQTTTSTELVNIDVKAISLTEQLQKSLVSQEKLGRQYLIINNKETIDLIREKFDQFPDEWEILLQLLPLDRVSMVASEYDKYRTEGERYLQLADDDLSLKKLEAEFKKSYLPAHNDFYQALTNFRENQQARVDRTLAALPRDGAHSFRMTLLLLLLGILLATPVALSVLLGIHNSLRQLTRATHQIAEGNYAVDINLSAHDEFGKLAREFQSMGRKLQEFEASNLDASPLTHLPGNMVIQRRVEGLLKDKVPFAHAFVDLDHFKAFNDRYGYQKGSDIISAVGDIISEIIKIEGDEDDFVGHIGGDDYIFLTSTEKVEHLAKRVIEEFDSMIPHYYSDEDRHSGFFICQDRFGVERQFPLMTISISIICSDTSNYDSAIAISHECAKMKEHLKRLPGSNYLIDRRRGKS